MKLKNFFDEDFLRAVENWTENAENYLDTIKNQVPKEIAPGDVVRLKCGGKSMVVDEAKDEILICYTNDSSTNLPITITVPKRVVEVIA